MKRLAGAGVAPLMALVALAWAGLALPGASSYALRVLTMAGIYAILALGYRFIFGLAGALSLAQGSFMGIGAYASGILALRWGVPFDLALPASIGLPVALALLVAIPVLRLQTHYFALATLLLGQMALLLATHWQEVTGGANGLGGVPPLSLLGVGLPGRLPALLLVWSLVAACGALAWQLGRGRLGDSYALMRASPTAAAAIGIDTARLRLFAFLLSAAYAGLAGSLYVHVVGVLSPDVLGFPVMVTCLTIAVVGSRTRVAGAVAGAVLIVQLPEWARFLRDDYLLAYGCLLLAMVVALPGGLVEAADRLLARLVPPGAPTLPAPVAVAPAAPAMPGELLRIDGLGRSFGGVRALHGVTLALRPGEILGLIGPNGSGKTTLLNAVSGLFPADAGSIRLGGRDVTRCKPHRIAGLGVARSFQVPALVPGMSALDNAAVAGGRDRALARAEAMFLLQQAGAAAHAATDAAALPAAAARQVEIARALATRPRLLLLDEPAAGLDVAERVELAALLRRIAAGGVALLVIEHDMGFLAPLADRLVCLDHGEVIAAGTPAEVQADPGVIAAYLGAPP